MGGCVGGLLIGFVYYRFGVLQPALQRRVRLLRRERGGQRGGGSGTRLGHCGRAKVSRHAANSFWVRCVYRLHLLAIT